MTIYQKNLLYRSIVPNKPDKLFILSGATASNSKAIAQSNKTFNKSSSVTLGFLILIIAPPLSIKKIFKQFI